MATGTIKKLVNDRGFGFIAQSDGTSVSYEYYGDGRVKKVTDASGVQTFTYDTANADEVSVTVAGGLGESDTGGPTMNLVPRLGGNAFSGQAFYNTAGKWSAGNNVDAALEAIGRPITLDDLPNAFATLLAGEARGRFVVSLAN